ncbi:Pyoverdine/dityrosine biosynthesis protein-domain-containing protein [Durotheca rogersii]|uniref:Pyoverdine/dityrosine biosynthesis protein-domain-containing protein n=1 Tax=Durotheca rogersii TaxID=419775 RepID=UPI00221FCFCB|nr:Pyoverdine/dityrosine biosynthesis protein-domain-containing protein [Durotheca rogersii]KAI5861028.1 Pyoverdine/dityrosine biosynthesis protein-domain-containing protein [Durotheca rogersii]
MPSALKLDDTEGPEPLAGPAAQPEKPQPTHLETASHILSVLSRYKLSKNLSPPKAGDGDFRFLTQIRDKVAAGEPILMCLPAFPFKSPNTTAKVLGRLPDKAEEFALAHLDGLCAAIEDIYPPGARLMIVSDGLVYNDLLSVPDKDVWAYGEALRTMRASKGFRHIEFCRLKDIVHVDIPNELDEIKYVANATNFRHALLKQFGNPDFNVSLRISEDEDTCLTYRGYIKFLETDLQYVYPIGEGRSKSKYKKGVEYVAKQMLMRGDAFARAVRERFPDRLRLSIHASTGESKLSISLLPTDTFFTTPWHCSIAFRLDGTVVTGHRSDFDVDGTFELVHDENGRPSFFREKSDLLSWPKSVEGEGVAIKCEPLYPVGLLIRPAAGRNMLSIGDIDAGKVRALAEMNSPVVLRGFAQTRNRDRFVKKASELGKPLPWKFGLVLEVKDRGTDSRGLNNVLSTEWMPFHYDGLFKMGKRLRDDGTEEVVSTPPKFQFFTAVTTSPPDTGFTLFSSSTLILKNLPPQLPLSYLRGLTWTVSTSSFDCSLIQGLPLIVDHPATGRPCLRYHEPWPQSKTQFEATYVAIDNASRAVSPTTSGSDTDVELDSFGSAPSLDGPAICDTLTSLLHDRRIVYYHSWEKGDLLVNDNTLTMHTRSDFTAGCDRELWRIHLD